MNSFSKVIIEFNSKVITLVIVLLSTTSALADSNLFEAVTNNDIQGVISLIDDDVSVNDKNELGWTPLHLAAQYGYIDIVTLLIDNGADVNAVNDGGSSVLHVATFKNRIDIAKLLLEYKVNIFFKNKYGKTALDYAIENDYYELADMLKQEYPDSSFKHVAQVKKEKADDEFAKHLFHCGPFLAISTGTIDFASASEDITYDVGRVVGLSIETGLEEMKHSVAFGYLYAKHSSDKSGCTYTTTYNRISFTYTRFFIYYSKVRPFAKAGIGYSWIKEKQESTSPNNAGYENKYEHEPRGEVSIGTDLYITPIISARLYFSLFDFYKGNMGNGFCVGLILGM